MWLSNNPLFRTICCILLIICFSSCSTKNSEINKAFNKKYGEEIDKIRVARTPPAKKSKTKQTKLNFSPARIGDWDDPDAPESASYRQYYANVDLEEYEQTLPRNFFPDGQVHQKGKSQNSLPRNIFKIRYYTKLSPPFRRSGVDFDAIRVPPQDAYGVTTAMSDKEYLLVGNGSLQKNIDQINSGRNSEDVEMSKILIKEQRQLRRRQKMVKVFW